LSEQFSKQLSAALRVLVGIVRLKNGPEDLPVSASLLVATIVLATIPDALIFAILPTPADASPVLLIVIGIVTTVIWYGALLRFAGKPERFLQTLTAVFGFQIILAPAMVFTAWFIVTYQKDPTWQLPAALLRSIVEIWALVILARILRSATQWPVFTCVVLAIANELLTLLLVSSLFPATAPAT
jgi:hypothetical protein